MKKLIIGLMFTISLNADFTDGNELQKWMNNTNKENGNRHSVGLFKGYISGVVDTGNNILFCTEDGVTRGQYMAVVIKYIENNPEKWNQGASVIVLEALTKAFPCKNKK